MPKLFNQFALQLRRSKENDPTKTILADIAFSKTLIETIEKIKEGKVEWKNYDEVFE